MRATATASALAICLAAPAAALTPQATRIVDEIKSANDMAALCKRGPRGVQQAVQAAVRSIMRGGGQTALGQQPKVYVAEAGKHVRTVECNFKQRGKRPEAPDS